MPVSFRIAVKSSEAHSSVRNRGDERGQQSGDVGSAHDSSDGAGVELHVGQIPGRVLAGELDVGVALFPESMRGARSELLRVEPLAVLLAEDHPLAAVDPIPVGLLEGETLLLFPRELAPGYYDRVIAACEQSGFQPRIKTFADPPPQAMLARVGATREIGLPPASFALHAAAARRGVVARTVVEPAICVDWSIVSAARSPSEAIARFVESARRCSEENIWLRSPADVAEAASR